MNRACSNAIRLTVELDYFLTRSEQDESNGFGKTEIDDYLYSRLEVQ